MVICIKGAEKLGELLFECNIAHNKVLDWYKMHEDDEVFNTEEGVKLRNHLGGMMKEEALAMLELGIIELNEAARHPDICISQETVNAFNDAVKHMEGS